ncbi:MAG: hypothetical protein V1774_07080, partial [Candidatus Eisenbacteria bacterium]
MRRVWARVGMIFVLLAAASAGARAGGPRTVADERYFTYDEILAQFDQWANLYGAIFHREIIGYSGAGGEP